MASGLSPKPNQLERLLELAAGVGFDNKPVDPREEALIQTLLAICTRRTGNDGRSNAVEALGGGDVTIPLLSLCANTTGVAQSLALHALKTWAEDHEDCLGICIRVNGIQLLLSVLAQALPASASADIAAAYSASLAVILLRALVREGGDQGAAAFLEARGVETLLGLLNQLAPDTRSQCLVLYLMNDVTRRSTEILDKAIASRAVDQVVAVLSQPISEATKFAALILNRWSLAAQHLPTIRAAGSVDMLMHVLESCCNGPEHITASIDPETVAYALSAFAIMTQDAVDLVRARLLASPAALTAVSRAVASYERCFKGVGFPHAMMCILLDGPEGAPLVAALASRGILPLWLSARHVGPQLAERAAQPDAVAAICAICDPEESLEVTIAMTHLLQRSPCPQFIDLVTQTGRLEHLTVNALAERSSSANSENTTFTSVLGQQQNIVTPAPCEDAYAPLSPARSSGMEVWTSAVAPPAAGPFTSTSSADFNTSEKVGTATGTTGDRSLMETAAATDPCTGVAEDPRPQLSLSLSSTSLSTPSPLHKQGSGRAVVPGASLDSCSAAVGRLVTLSRHNSMDNMAVDSETTPVASAKRQRTQGPSPSPAFRKEDVGVPRYDTLCFVVGGKEVHAVGFVLEAHSSFLRGLLSTVGHVGERVVVPQLAHFTPEAMHALFIKAVEWSYTGEVENLKSCPDSVFNLWLFADFLQIDGLQRYCEAEMEQWFGSSLEIVMQSLKLADAYASAEPLRYRIARHVLALLADCERTGEADSLINAAVAAGHKDMLAGAMAAEIRTCLRVATAVL